MASKKQYGLIIPNKKGAKQILDSSAASSRGEGPAAAALEKLKGTNIFERIESPEDSEEEGEITDDWVAETQKARAKASKTVAEEAPDLDPTLYQYDEVYDEIEEQKNKRAVGSLASAGVVVAKPKAKYISDLKVAAEKRQRDRDRRNERRIQKEREKEGEMFADKEQFVTTAYRKKLEELKQAELEEERQKKLEELTDVTKQSDMRGFYGHLYKQTFQDEGGVKKEVEPKPERAESVEREAPETKGGSVEEEEESPPKRRKVEDTPPKARKDKRANLRQRRTSESEEEEAETKSPSTNERRDRSKRAVDDKENRSRDRSKDGEGRRRRSSKDRDSQRNKNGDTRESEKGRNPRRTSRERRSSRDRDKGKDSHRGAKEKDRGAKERDRSAKERDRSAKDKEKEHRREDKKNEAKSSGEEKKRKEKERRTLEEIFQKRTVGEVFQAARQRYLERKEQRESRES